MLIGRDNDRPGEAEMREAARELRAPSTFGTAPDASIPASIDALTREQTRHAITRDALAGLVSALRAQVTEWRAQAEHLYGEIENDYAAGYSACADNLEALLAGHTGTLPDDDEVLADSPAPGVEVAR